MRWEGCGAKGILLLFVKGCGGGGGGRGVGVRGGLQYTMEKLVFVNVCELRGCGG